ncbi:MAG: mechanosensitive ion channel [Minwuia sp.]|nr:mechanosensitive ion channel [Minwuia sp.]
MEKMSGLSDSVLATLSDLTAQFIAFLPNLVAALILALVGWLVARLMRTITLRLSGGISRLTDRMPLGLSEVAGGRPLGRILSEIVYWSILILFLATAGSMLGLDVLSAWLEELIIWLPSILSGLLIIAAGLVMGNLAYRMSVNMLTSLSTTQREVTGRTLQAVTVGMLLIVGVDQVGIDVTIVITVVGIVLAAILGGAAVAFALGARTLVANLIGARHLGPDYRVGERVRVGEVQGTILALTATAVVIETERGRASVPAKAFLEQTSMIIGEDVDDA